MPHHTMRIVEKKKTKLSILVSVKSPIYSVISEKKSQKVLLNNIKNAGVCRTISKKMTFFMLILEWEILKRRYFCSY